MKYLNLIVASACMILLMACGSGKISDKDAKYDLAELYTIANKGNYEVVSNFAYPSASNALTQISNSGLLPPGSSAAAIDIIGTTNYVRFNDGEVTGYLPFYGERLNGARIANNDNAIEFQGTPEELKVITNEKKQLIEVSFKASDRDSEDYLVNMTLYRNGSASLSVQSSERSFMRYSGEFMVLTEIE